MKIILLILAIWGEFSMTKESQLLFQRIIYEVKTQLMDKVLNNYKEHQIVFHYDDISKFDLDILVRQDLYTLKQSYKKLYGATNSLKRPAENKIVNIYLSNPTILKDNVYFFGTNDVNIWLAYNFNDTCWDFLNVSVPSLLYIVDVMNNKLFSYSHNYGMPHVIREINEDNGALDIPLINSDFRNFHGHAFSVYYVDFPQYFWCDYIEKRCIPHGFEYIILRVMSDKLNFTYKLKNNKDEQSNGAWSTMLEAVERGDADWAICCVSVTTERLRLFDVTTYLSELKYNFLFVSTNEIIFWTDVADLLLLSHWDIYILIFASTLLISVVSKLSSSATNPFLCHVVKALKSLLEQPYSSKVSNVIQVKLLFLIWWFIALCITTLFKSLLAASLIKADFKEPETIEELLAEGYTFLVESDVWLVLKNILMASPNPESREVLRRTTVSPNLCEAVQMMFLRKVSVIAYEAPLIYRVLQYCTEKFPGQFSQLRLLKHYSFPTAHHAWMMRKFTPFQEQFSVIIGRMHDAGLIFHWSKEFTGTIRKSKEEHIHVPVSSISLKQIAPSLAIYGFGIILSIIVFLKEIIYEKIKYGL